MRGFGLKSLILEASMNWTGFCILFVCLCFWTACAVACLWGIVRAVVYLYELFSLMRQTPKIVGRTIPEKCTKCQWRKKDKCVLRVSLDPTETCFDPILIG